MGAAHRAENNRIGGFGFGDGGIGDCNAVFVVGGAADQIGLARELRLPLGLVEKGNHALDLGHGLDADAVAGKQEEFEIGHDLADPGVRSCEG